MYYILFFILTALIALTLVDYLRYGITPSPTSMKVIDEVFKVIPSDFQGRFVDLGSGFGTLLFTLSSRFPLCDYSGYEASMFPFLISKLLLFTRSNITLKKKNFMRESLQSYDLVFCYLYPKISPLLAHKLKQDLKPGSWVISHTFALKELHLIKTVRAKDLYRTPIYLYQI